MKILVLFLFSSLALAQATPHTATLGITATQPSTVTGNNYYSSLVSGGPYTKLTPCQNLAPTVKCQLTGLTASTTYYFVATALCPTCAAPQESPFSTQVSGTTKADGPPPPAAPVLDQIIISMNPPKAELTWHLAKNTNVIRQFVQRQQPKTAAWVNQKQLKPTVNQYTDATVKRNTTYPYRIQAVLKNGNPANSNVMIAVVK